MKFSVELDLVKGVVTLASDFSHREFTLRRQFHCPECSGVVRNALAEALYAAEIYARAADRGEVRKDVRRAIFAYQSSELMKLIVRYDERGSRTLSIDDFGVLDDLETLGD